MDVHIEQFEKKTAERELNNDRRHNDSVDLTKQLVGHIGTFTELFKVLVDHKVHGNNDKKS